MSDMEKQIGIVENVNNYFDTFTLYWMEKRLIAINTGQLETVGIWNAYIEVTKREQLRGLTLDEILDKDKRSFELPYSDMKDVKLVDLKSGLEIWKKPKLEINGVFNLDENILQPEIMIRENSM